MPSSSMVAAIAVVAIIGMGTMGGLYYGAVSSRSTVTQYQTVTSTSTSFSAVAVTATQTETVTLTSTATSISTTMQSTTVTSTSTATQTDYSTTTQTQTVTSTSTTSVYPVPNNVTFVFSVPSSGDSGSYQIAINGQTQYSGSANGQNVTMQLTNLFSGEKILISFSSSTGFAHTPYSYAYLYNNGLLVANGESAGTSATISYII